MNTFSKCGLSLVLVTVTAIALSQLHSSRVSNRESNQSTPNQILGKVATIAVSRVASSLSLTSHSPFSFNATFKPSPNPAPVGTGGAGSR